jgi:DNA invertase Pin-like site-specific DNA recombinase
MNQAKRVTVIGYVRVSTEHQADGGVSIDAQREKVVAYAKAMDLRLAEIVEDAGASAKSVNRPGLQRVLAALERGNASGLLITKLDRLTRSVRDLGDLVERYFASRFALLSVSDSIDTRTAAGRLVLNVLTSVAQWEREAVGERTRDALTHLRSSGVRLGGEAMGWRRAEATDGEGRRIVEGLAEERETIAMIVSLSRKGRSLRAICAALTEAGRRTKKERRWSPKVVRAILLREAEAA